MKNKLDLKKCIKQILITCTLFVLVTISFNVYKYHQYTKNYNNKINSLVGTILEKYPSVTENEIIEVINEKHDNATLEKYGINIENDSVIIKNNTLFIGFLIVDIGIIIFVSMIILYLFLKYNKKKDNEINDITKLIEEINRKNYKLDIDNISEEELSILKNEIYKTTIMLKEQALRANSDKLNLKKSLSDISHQLKTPLTSILITLDNIIDNPDMDTNTRFKFIINIKREITNINFLVQNILKLSKFDANAINFINECVFINEIIGEAIKNVSSLCDLKNIAINYTGNDIKLNCDLKWQIEAITNILKNCVEHSYNDSIIEIEVLENKMYKEIIIKDFGVGIDEEDLKHIFDRFYKGKNSSKDSVGIGLSLAKTIIEQSNGNVTALSKKGKGTVFKIKYYSYERSLK